MSRILSSRFEVTTATTEAAGHATELAGAASRSGDDLAVAVLGGDGTVNEAVNGLAGTPVPLAVLPGGGADVFARALGIPKEPEVAAALLAARSFRPSRLLPLGRISGGDQRPHRLFTSNCGMGFDAAIVRSVERRQGLKRVMGDWSFVLLGLRLFVAGYDRRCPHLELRTGAGAPHRDLYLVVVQNTSPFTFLGRRGLRLCPRAGFGRDLDAFGMDSMRARVLLPVLFSAFASARRIPGPHVVYEEDRVRLVVRADRPMPVQCDGEYLGERSEMVVESVPWALRVLW